MYTCYIQSLRILAGLNLTSSKFSEDTFSRDVAHFLLISSVDYDY